MPKALTLTNIRAGFTSTDHQLGCDQYVFFHAMDTGGWRNDAGVPDQVSITGNTVQFHVKLRNLRDMRDHTPLTSEPIEVSLDVTKIDHVVQSTRPGRDTARDGYLIEIDFDKGYEEIAKSGFAHASARPTTNTLWTVGSQRKT